MTLSNQPLRKYYSVPKKRTYEELGDGNVRVTDANGRTGLFKWSGQFIKGELTQTNIHMLSWTGGPNIPKALNYRWPEVPADITRPSGWPEEQEKLLPYQLGKRA